MEAYSLKDIVVLINVLIIRHRLSCSLHRLKQNKSSHIYIKNKSMPILLEGIRAFIPFVQKRSIHNKTNSPVTPAVSYENAETLKKEIVKNNRGKAGVYR